MASWREAPAAIIGRVKGTQSNVIKQPGWATHHFESPTDERDLAGRRPPPLRQFPGFLVTDQL